MSEAIYTSPLAHLDDYDDAASLSIAIDEISDRGMIDLRGEAGSAKFKQAARAALGVDLPLTPRSVASKGDITILWLSIDQWLVCCPRDKTKGLLGKLCRNLDTVHSLCVDVSDTRAIIRLQGDSAREVLMKGSSVDFTQREYKAGMVRRLMFAEIAALVHIVSDEPCTVDLYVFRSYADYTWKWIKATARPAARIGLFGTG